MGCTTHRRDISHADIKLLVNFSHALSLMTREPGHRWGYVYDLGSVEILIPVWSERNGGWELIRYKPYLREAIGLEARSFRAIARSLKIKETQLVDLLHRLSMLAIEPETLHFRMAFKGVPINCTHSEDHVRWESGFIIERRRALETFHHQGQGVRNGQ